MVTILITERYRGRLKPQTAYIRVDELECLDEVKRIIPHVKPGSTITILDRLESRNDWLFTVPTEV